MPDVSFRANGSDLRHSMRGTEGSNPPPYDATGRSDPTRIGAAEDRGRDLDADLSRHLDVKDKLELGGFVW